MEPEPVAHYDFIGKILSLTSIQAAIVLADGGALVKIGAPIGNVPILAI